VHGKKHVQAKPSTMCDLTDDIECEFSTIVSRMGFKSTLQLIVGFLQGSEFLSMVRCMPHKFGITLPSSSHSKYSHHGKVALHDAAWNDGLYLSSVDAADDAGAGVGGDDDNDDDGDDGDMDVIVDGDAVDDNVDTAAVADGHALFLSEYIAPVWLRVCTVLGLRRPTSVRAHNRKTAIK
jgi:hypothetical protein